MELGQTSLEIDKLCVDKFHSWKQRIQIILSLRYPYEVISAQDPPTDEDTHSTW